MRTLYCEYCNKEVPFVHKEELKVEIVNHQEITYREKVSYCANCHNEIYNSEDYDENIDSYQEAVRSVSGIISKEEIVEIITKYNIGKKPLALLLGWGEATIIRYLNGGNIEKLHSDELKKIKDDPTYMKEKLLRKRKVLTDVAYRKSISKVEELILSETNSKIYQFASYILEKNDEISNLALQKLLYFIQGIGIAIFSKNIYDTMPKAWAKGPVYPNIYHRFCSYGFAPLTMENTENDLTEDEKHLADMVVEVFGKYSGNYLKEMTHKTLPWQNARQGIKEGSPSSNLINYKSMEGYFKKEHEIYNFETLKGIEKYCTTLQNN